MAKSDVTQDLAEAIESLQKRRQELLSELEDIEQTFKQYGIDPAAGGRKRTRRGRKPGPKPGRKKGRKKGTRKKRGGGRGKYDKTAAESVIDFVRSFNGKPTTAQINGHWQTEGRGGKADNTITKLVQDGKLKRENIKGKRGSRYQVA